MSDTGTPPPARPVVVGVDGSPASEAAAATAARVARRRELPLRLVRALPAPGPGPADLPITHADRDSVRDAARARLAETVHALGLPEEAVTAVVREGPAELVLLHESRSAALVVLGADESAGVPGAGSGHVAGALVRRSACPVLVDRPPAARGTVVVGVSGAPGTAALLAATAEEAARRRCALLVLHGWSPSGTVPTSEPTAAVDEAQRELCRGYLEPLRAQFPDLAVEVRVVHGDPVDHLVRAAAVAELLVVGRRPQADRAGTAGRVAMAAATPVLVVPLETAAPPRRRRPAGSTQLHH